MSSSNCPLRPCLLSVSVQPSQLQKCLVAVNEWRNEKHFSCPVSNIPLLWASVPMPRTVLSDEEPLSKQHQVCFLAQQQHQGYLLCCFGSGAVTGAFLPLLETESCSMAPAGLEFGNLLPPLLKCTVARSYGSGLCHSTDTISLHPFKVDDNLPQATKCHFSPYRNIQGWREEDILSTCLTEKNFPRNPPRPLDLQCHL